MVKSQLQVTLALLTAAGAGATLAVALISLLTPASTVWQVPLIIAGVFMLVAGSAYAVTAHQRRRPDKRD